LIRKSRARGDIGEKECVSERIGGMVSRESKLILLRFIDDGEIIGSEIRKIIGPVKLWNKMRRGGGRKKYWG